MTLKNYNNKLKYLLQSKMKPKVPADKFINDFMAGIEKLLEKPFGDPIDVCPDSLARLSTMMLTVEELAGYYGIDLFTMKQHLREPELRQACLRGRAHGRAALRFVQFKTACNENSQTLNRLAKQYLGQPIGNTSLDDGLPEPGGPNMIQMPWTPEMEAEYKAIDAEFPELLVEEE